MQTIVWGKTELFRNQDQWNPVDIAIGPLASLEESRIALWALRGIWSFYEVGPLEDVRLELVGLFDEFEPTDVGRCGEPFVPRVACTKSYGLWVHGENGTGVAGERRPEDPWNNASGIEVGARLEFRWDRFSFAFTDYYGFNDLPYASLLFQYSRNVDPVTGRPRHTDVTGSCTTGAEAPLSGARHGPGSDRSHRQRRDREPQHQPVAVRLDLRRHGGRGAGGRRLGLRLHALQQQEQRGPRRLRRRVQLDRRRPDGRRGPPERAARRPARRAAPRRRPRCSRRSGPPAPTRSSTRARSCRPSFRSCTTASRTARRPSRRPSRASAPTPRPSRARCWGCDAFYQTDCDGVGAALGGFDLANMEASVTLQSFPWFEGTFFNSSWDTADDSLPQPGTVDALLQGYGADVPAGATKKHGIQVGDTTTGPAGTRYEDDGNGIDDDGDGNIKDLRILPGARIDAARRRPDRRRPAAGHRGLAVHPRRPRAVRHRRRRQHGWAGASVHRAALGERDGDRLLELPDARRRPSARRTAP